MGSPGGRRKAFADAGHLGRQSVETGTVASSPDPLLEETQGARCPHSKGRLCYNLDAYTFPGTNPRCGGVGWEVNPELLGEDLIGPEEQSCVRTFRAQSTTTPISGE